MNAIIDYFLIFYLLSATTFLVKSYQDKQIYTIDIKNFLLLPIGIWYHFIKK